LRILQIIDSLRPGGAEKMAINLANSLANRIEFSGLCATREEGLLKSQLSSNTYYLFIKRRSTFDFSAITMLNNYLHFNKIDIIHCHGTSYFLGLILKLLNPRLKLIWHDHLGERANKLKYNFPLLLLFSRLFDGIIAVNKEVLEWIRLNLKSKRSIFIPNFISTKFINELRNRSFDRSGITNIICVANLKKPKNHLNLLKAFKIVVGKSKNIELNLIGKNFHDNYHNELQNYLKFNNLTSNVHLLGERENVSEYLRKADIGVLASDSEGLPMAILEYGIAGLPVISTDVGECQNIIGSNGKIAKVNDPEDLAECILFYINNIKARKLDAFNLSKNITSNYSEESVIQIVLGFYLEVIKENN
jgi:glycosyltransferase involved in cell wall biosynthesis